MENNDSSPLLDTTFSTNLTGYLGFVQRNGKPKSVTVPTAQIKYKTPSILKYLILNDHPFN